MVESVNKKLLISVLTITSILILIVSCGGGSGGGEVEPGPSSKTATVSGTVLDSNGAPVSGALVSITSAPETILTDDNGDFSVQVEAGDHSISVKLGNSTVYQGSFSASDTAPVHLGDLTPANPFMIKDNADLSGTFLAGELRIESGVGQTTAMTVDFDGAENLNANIILDSLGHTGSDNATYSMAGDGGLSLSSSAPGEKMAGQITPDGALLSLVDTNTAGDDIGIVFGVKRSTGMTNASFNGTYIMSQLGFNPNPMFNRLQITADGSGNFDYQTLPSGDSGSATYSVADDGSVTIAGEANTLGQLSNDGSVLLIVDTSSDYAHIAVGIRQSSNMANSDFSGLYYVVLFHSENMDINTVVTGEGNVTADGAGNVAISIQQRSEGLPSSDDAIINIGSDGTCTTGSGLVGQLSGNGGLFAFPDMDGPSDLYTYMVGIRLP